MVGTEDSQRIAAMAPTATQTQTDLSVQVETSADQSTADDEWLPHRVTPNTALLIALVALAVALIASIWTNVRLYSWRRHLPASQMSVVPELLIEAVERQKKDAKDHQRSLASTHGALTHEIGETRAKQEELLESFLLLNGQLTQKDEELTRLRQGYEEFVSKKLLARIIRVDQALTEEVEDSDRSESIPRQVLLDLHLLSQDALDEAGVEVFAPQPGADIREEFGVGDNPIVEVPPSPDMAHQVIETITRGYRLRTANGLHCLSPARVRAYGEFQEGK